MPGLSMTVYGPFYIDVISLCFPLVWRDCVAKLYHQLGTLLQGLDDRVETSGEYVAVVGVR